MTPLFPPPPVFDLPLSKGGDLYVIIVYKPLVVDGSGNPVLDSSGNPQYAVANYPTGATVKLEIDTTSPISIPATITGSQAVIMDDFTITDLIPHGMFWRVKITYLSGLDQVLANGRTVRKDGKA